MEGYPQRDGHVPTFLDVGDTVTTSGPDTAFPEAAQT